MRTIQFPPGTRNSTRETAGSLAWAMNRRGGARNGWASENVVRSILQYFRDNNIETPDATHLSNVMHLLVSWGYATRKMSGTGRRTIEFKFDDDVSLTGFSPVTRTNGIQPTGSPVPRILAPHGANDATLPPSQRPQSAPRSQYGPRSQPEEPLATELPPLPFHDRELLPELYRFDELEVEIREWCETVEGAEAYAKWIDAVIDQFRRKKETNL